MGATTLIGWCTCTFNLWWGCLEVSPACDFCYARMLAKRFGYSVWGKDAERRFFGDAHWDEPLRWNERAEKAGIRERMFAMSMGDWGEERDDAVGAEMERCRERFWRLVPQLTAIDVLLLTKRAQAYRRLVPPEILALSNVWPGITVEGPDQLWRATELVKLHAAGPRWVSHEPALELTDFSGHLSPYWTAINAPCSSSRRETPSGSEWHGHRIDWLIVGVESRGSFAGRNADGYEACARFLIEQSRAADVPVFHKQTVVNGRVSHDPREWDATLRVQEFPR